MTAKFKFNFLSSALLLAFILPFESAAKDATFKGDNYSITLSYTDTSCPGDALFIRAVFLATSKDAPAELLPNTAKASLFLDQKEIGASSFYLIDSSTSTSQKSMLTGIPLSSWWQPGNYHLTVYYQIGGQKNMEFNLPFSLVEKTFNSETIPLDQKNTEIKTDSSPARAQQIDRLNEILSTITSSDVYQLTPFAPPTTSTRRTSYYADRRVYKYTNGKSSTSLHYGTDYGVPTGTPVTACAKGKVVLAEMRNSTGWSVVIEHLPGLYSLYYHMSKLEVQVGDEVEMGKEIGLSGSTGLATGPHLHWEMRLNMQAVNPDFFTTDFTFSGTSN